MLLQTCWYTFYGLAADCQEYCFTKVFFSKFIFDPKQFFGQIRIKSSWGRAPLSFKNNLLVPRKKKTCRFLGENFKISVKANK